MKWSIKLGRFLGIDVYIHGAFLLLLAFVGMAHWMAGQTVTAALAGVFFFSLIFLCVLLHEYGHALAARRFGVRTRDITLLPFGGVASLERMPEKPVQELCIALAGPAVNVVISLVLAGWLTITGGWEPLSALGPAEGGVVERLLAVNVGLVLFNMLPAFPMDGGRVLRALLAMKMDYARATRIAATVGKGMAGIFAVVGLLGNPMLLIIAVFVWLGASQEAGAVEMKASYRGIAVRDAMLTDFKTLRAEETLADAASLILAGSQKDFPVVRDCRVVGLLLREDLFAAIERHPSDMRVERVMRTDFATCEEGEVLDDALLQAGLGHGLTLPVLNRGMLVGLLTAENLAELHVLRRASQRQGFRHFSFRMPSPLSTKLHPRNAATHS